MALNVLMESSFKDEFDETCGEDRGARRQAQPNFLSGALCSEEITDIKRSSMWSLQKASKAAAAEEPATDSLLNELIHVLSAQGQCQLWKEVDKPDPPVVDICVRCWEMEDAVTTPIIYAAPTATPKLLNMVSWQRGIHI